MNSPTPTPRPQPGMASVVHRNISSLMALRQQEESQRKLSERIADVITAFAGSMSFVYLHALLYGLWLLINSRVLPLLTPWDPFPFVMLAMLASVEAIFLSTFILITQNRMQKLADRRAELDLQISLLTEHELTRVVRVLDTLTHHLQIPSPPEELQEAKQDINPAQVAQAIEAAEHQTNPPPTPIHLP